MYRSFWLESHSGTKYNLSLGRSFFHSFSSIARPRSIGTAQVGLWSRCSDIDEKFQETRVNGEIAFIGNGYGNLASFLDFYHKDVRLSENIEQRMKLYYQAPNMSEPVYAYVDISNLEFSEKREDGYHAADVEFLFFSPWLLNDTFSLDNTIAPPAADTLDYTLDFTLSSYSIEGEINEVWGNDGDTEGIYTLRITGPATNPSYKIGTKEVEFDLILGEGETLYINAIPNAAKIEVNGVEDDSMFNPFKASPWFTVPRGDVPIQIRATGGKYELTMKKVYIDARRT